MVIMEKDTQRMLVSAALVVALYLAVVCPCKEYLACHKKLFMAALGVAGSIPIAM